MVRSNSILLVVLGLSLALNGYLLVGKLGLQTQSVDISQNIPVSQPALPTSAQTPLSESLAKSAVLPDRREIEELQRLAAAGNFDAAVRIYHRLDSAKNPSGRTQARGIKNDWALLVIQWLEGNDLIRAEQLINAFLNQRPYDIEFRELEAQWLFSKSAFIEAIDKYYALLGESRPQSQGVYVAKIQEIVQQRIELLSAEKAWQPLADFLQRLIWYEPQHPPYILALAKTYIELERYQQAKTELFAIQYDPNYRGRVKALLEAIALRELKAVTIPLTPQRQHYLVSGQIDGDYGIQLMIDTGASLSVLSARAFNTLKSKTAPELIRYSTINTAGGQVRAPIYRFNTFQIGDYLIRDALFVVMDLNESDGNQGLLGMSYLQNFDFQLDQKNNLLLLSPRK